MRTESVSGHRRRDKKGHWVKVKKFNRKAKPKAPGRIRPFKQKFEVTYYRDKQGRIAAKRKYRKIR